MKVEYLGNQELLQLKKAAFLASSTISSETVLQVYDWATEMRNRGECVVSGFSSKGSVWSAVSVASWSKTCFISY